MTTFYHVKIISKYYYYLSFKFLFGRITLAKTLTYGFEIEDNKKNVYGKQVYL